MSPPSVFFPIITLYHNTDFPFVPFTLWLSYLNVRLIMQGIFGRLTALFLAAGTVTLNRRPINTFRMNECFHILSEPFSLIFINFLKL